MPRRLFLFIFITILTSPVVYSSSPDSSPSPSTESPASKTTPTYDEFGREIFPFSHLDVLPVPIAQPAPVYPPELREKRIPGRVIVEFVITSKGSVSSVNVISSNDPRFEEASIRAVGKWSFKPGKIKGQDVATRLRMPLQFQMGAQPIISENGYEADLATVERIEQERKAYPLTKINSVPVPRSKPDPNYPFKMRYAGIKGEVIVDFIVDQKGDVQTPYARRSTNRAFEEEAVIAVRKWKFEPIRVQGKPVNVNLALPVVFWHAEPVYFAPQTEGQVKRIKKLRTAYPVSDVDTKAVPISSPLPEYKRWMLQAKIEGAVVMDLIVDPEGHVQTPCAISFTDSDLIQPALDTIAKWTFKPALKDGKPVNDHLNFMIFFEMPKTPSKAK